MKGIGCFEDPEVPLPESWVHFDHFIGYHRPDKCDVESNLLGLSLKISVTWPQEVITFQAQGKASLVVVVVVGFHDCG